MPTIGIRVDEETKRKWDILNKHPDRIGTKELKKALREIIEKYSWWIDAYVKAIEISGIENATTPNEPEDEALLTKISEEEIISEI